MNLPIRFPNPADVIAEEAARFRALTPQERVQSIRGMIQTGMLLMQVSQKSAFVQEYDAEDRIARRQAIREFIARHAL